MLYIIKKSKNKNLTSILLSALMDSFINLFCWGIIAYDVLIYLINSVYKLFNKN